VAVRSAILATAWLLVFITPSGSRQYTSTQAVSTWISVDLEIICYFRYSKSPTAMSNRLLSSQFRHSVCVCLSYLFVMVKHCDTKIHARSIDIKNDNI